MKGDTALASRRSGKCSLSHSLAGKSATPSFQCPSGPRAVFQPQRCLDNIGVTTAHCARNVF